MSVILSHFYCFTSRIRFESSKSTLTSRCRKQTLKYVHIIDNGKTYDFVQMNTAMIPFRNFIILSYIEIFVKFRSLSILVSVLFDWFHVKFPIRSIYEIHSHMNNLHVIKTILISRCNFRWKTCQRLHICSIIRFFISWTVICQVYGNQNYLDYSNQNFQTMRIRKLTHSFEKDLQTR